MSASAASAPSAIPGGTPGSGTRVVSAAGEGCPLCGAPLAPEQEWCLSCGAAARTRLAAPPNWKAPIIAILAVVVLSLGVLAVSLVKLTGSSSSSGGGIVATKTVVTAPAQSTAPATPAAPGTTTAPTTTTGPGATAAPGGTTAPTTTAAPSTVAPGVPLFGPTGKGTSTGAAPTTTTPQTKAPRTTTHPTTTKPKAVTPAPTTSPTRTAEPAPPGAPSKARQRELFKKLPPAAKKKLEELSRTG